MAEEKRIGPTRVRITGQGTPLVLIHGVGLSLDHWDLMTPYLARDFQVIAYDAIGHGGSDKPAGPYEMPLFVHQLDELLRALKIESCDIVGYSMGALIAEGFALKYPQKLRRLILLSGVYNRTPEERAVVLERITQARKEGDAGFKAGIEKGLDRYFTPEFRAAHPEVVQEFVRRFQSNDLECFLAAYYFFGTADADLVEDVRKIACPTFVVTGENDQRSTAAMSRSIAAQMPNAKVEIIAGERHMPTLQMPEKLSRLFRDFLREEPFTA
ncbi:MAG: alpha/beta fold hydrolase [Pseudorhodoplanes sp.]